MIVTLHGLLPSVRSDPKFNVRSAKLRSMLIKQEQGVWMLKFRATQGHEYLSKIVAVCRLQRKKLDLHYVVIRPRELDSDNLAASVNKLITDGLVAFKLIPSDQPAILSETAVWVKGKAENARVELHIGMSDQTAEWQKHPNKQEIR